MNERTRSYLQGRFRDYYRRHPPSTEPGDGPLFPPAPTTREWGYIPFASGERTTMIRHEALATSGDLVTFLTHNRPRHVYHSTARYDRPGVDAMDAKGWQGADLVFDLDADHLPGVDPETANYRDMLLTCRQEAVDLVEMLREDFGFGDLLVTFSGNRGFHVHVHAEATRSLGQTPRREIVEYVRGEGLTFDALATEVSVAGGTDTKRRLRTDGGWGRRLHQDLVTYLERRHEESRADAIETVAAIPDMGETSAETVVSLAHDRWDAIQAGEIDLHRHFVRFVRAFLEAEVTGTGPAIDEPVTTDIRRLIRLPGSLHGGTGFRVQPIPPDALSSFDPTVDAIVSDFQSTDIAVELHEPFVESLGGTEWTLEPGIHELPEYLGLFMMARGVADKVRE